jgi:hypothetical protein
VSRCPSQDTHRRAEQQCENYENADCVKGIPIIVLHRRRRHCSIARSKISEVGDGRCAGQMVQRDDRYNQQDEDDESDEYVNQFIDASAAVE